MNFPNPLTSIPKSFYLPLAVIGGGLLAWRFLSGGGDAPSSNPATSTLGYDPSLVALGVNAALERDKFNAEIGLEKQRLETTANLSSQAMQTELQAVEKQYSFQRDELASDERITMKKADIENAKIQAELGYANSQAHKELDYMHALGNTEILQSYNLANYQAMISHDLGKKGISAQKESSRLGFLGGIAKMFF